MNTYQCIFIIPPVHFYVWLIGARNKTERKLVPMEYNKLIHFMLEWQQQLHEKYSLTNIIKKCIEDNQCVLCCGVWIYNSMKHSFAKYAITFFPTSSCRWQLLDYEQTGESSVKFNCQKLTIKMDTTLLSLAIFKLSIPK